MSENSYIRADGLSKQFVVRKKREKGALFREKETVQALKDVSFEIEKGELIGYIGPNGAGKSTTVKILSGILTPDGGSAIVGGQIPWRDRFLLVRRPPGSTRLPYTTRFRSGVHDCVSQGYLQDSGCIISEKTG